MSLDSWDLLSSYAGLLGLATASIYAGAHGALPPTKHPKKDGPRHDDDDERELPERLSSEDAWLFPVIGSVVLFGMYVVVKYFGTEWINWLLQWYFTIACIGSGSKALISFVRWLLGPVRWRQYKKIKIRIVESAGNDMHTLSLRVPSLLLIPCGAIPSLVYSFGPSQARKSALVTDILALSLAFNALSLLTLDSFKTGCILLSGLFLYDVWWVFGTEVMVKVATNLDVPIKILWPKSLTFATENGFTMLGLGDIVVPGMFIALALRYDQHRAEVRGDAHKGFAKPYFYAALGAYFLGLCTTMIVMHTFRAAQPALLYLSPACILSFVITATIRGERGEAWSWHDGETEPEATAAADARPNGARASPRPPQQPLAPSNGGLLSRIPRIRWEARVQPRSTPS